MTDKLDLSVTQSDTVVLKEKGFILEKIIGQGSYAKVRQDVRGAQFLFGITT